MRRPTPSPPAVIFLSACALMVPPSEISSCCWRGRVCVCVRVLVESVLFALQTWRGSMGERVWATRARASKRGRSSRRGCSRKASISTARGIAPEEQRTPQREQFLRVPIPAPQPKALCAASSHAPRSHARNQRSPCTFCPCGCRAPSASPCRRRAPGAPHPRLRRAWPAPRSAARARPAAPRQRRAAWTAPPVAARRRAAATSQRARCRAQSEQGCRKQSLACASSCALCLIDAVCAWGWVLIAIRERVGARARVRAVFMAARVCAEGQACLGPRSPSTRRTTPLAAAITRAKALHWLPPQDSSSAHQSLRATRRIALRILCCLQGDPRHSHSILQQRESPSVEGVSRGGLRE